MSSLIDSGVPIVRSLEVVADALQNIYYKKAILEVAQSVKGGAKIGQSLEKFQNIYPALVVQMVEIGEETGETGQILKKLAEFYEEEVDRDTKNMSAIVEPLMMIIIGIVVGFFAISMFQPIYSMLGAIK